MRVEQARENVFTVTATSQELSALIAAARMALDMMRGDPSAPAEPVEALQRILRDYDAALARARPEKGNGR